MIAVKRTRPRKARRRNREKARRSGRTGLPRLALAPTFVITLVFIYGYILLDRGAAIHAVADAAQLQVRRVALVRGAVRQ